MLVSVSGPGDVSIRKELHDRANIDVVWKPKVQGTHPVSVHLICFHQPLQCIHIDFSLYRTHTSCTLVRSFLNVCVRARVSRSCML